MAESPPKACSLCGEIGAGGTTCARCGSALPTETALPQAGSSPGLPHTEVRHGMAGYDTTPQELPKAGRREPQSFAAPAMRTPKRAAKKPGKRASIPFVLLPSGFGYIVKSGFSIAFLLILAAAIGLLTLAHYESQGPKASIPRLAARYLSALAATDYASAYYLLSAAAQARCSIDDYRRLRGAGEWTISDIKLVALEPEAGEVSYRWSAADQPAVTAYLFFAMRKTAGSFLIISTCSRRSRRRCAPTIRTWPCSIPRRPCSSTRATPWPEPTSAKRPISVNSTIRPKANARRRWAFPPSTPPAFPRKAWLTSS